MTLTLLLIFWVLCLAIIGILFRNTFQKSEFLMYVIRDCQFDYRYFADGALYETKNDILEQLMDFHDIDFSGTDNKDNELSIQEFFEFWKINTEEKQLKYILDYGEWTIEEVILPRKEYIKWKKEEKRETKLIKSILAGGIK